MQCRCRCSLRLRPAPCHGSAEPWHGSGAGREGLPPPDERHLGRHHRHEQHVGVERKPGHVGDGVAVANLDDGRTIQLSLPLDGYAGGSLDAALDEVRQRFGSKAVMRAVLLGRDEGFGPPLLPD